MKITITTFLTLLLLPIAITTMAASSDEQQLHTLLDEFLANKVADDLKNHGRFWADDLIYTSSAGKRFNKQFILDGINAEQSANNEQGAEAAPKYHAEQVDIRVYDNSAVVAFKLVATIDDADSSATIYYFNTGTFLKRNGIWQAAAWQATKIPME